MCCNDDDQECMPFRAPGTVPIGLEVGENEAVIFLLASADGFFCTLSGTELVFSSQMRRIEIWVTSKERGSRKIIGEGIRRTPKMTSEKTSGGPQA